MSDLIGNPEDRFSHNEAQIYPAADRPYASPVKSQIFFSFIHSFININLLVFKNILMLIPFVFSEQRTYLRKLHAFSIFDTTYRI